MIREVRERGIYIWGYIEELRKVVGTRPLILVGSAIIILNDNQEVLLQYRSDTYDWGVPGGAMELGETTEETARRELFEETGLTAKNNAISWCSIRKKKYISVIRMAMKFSMLFICIRHIM